MTTRMLRCDSCKSARSWFQCDGCGADTTGDDTAVQLDIRLGDDPGTIRTRLDYCRPCAAQHMPAAVGIVPGSDLPVRTGPPEKP